MLHIPSNITKVQRNFWIYFNKALKSNKLILVGSKTPNDVNVKGITIQSKEVVNNYKNKQNKK